MTTQKQPTFKKTINKYMKEQLAKDLKKQPTKQEQTLSDKAKILSRGHKRNGQEVFTKSDVRDFIKKLKEEMKTRYYDVPDWTFIKIIDKLAGEKLI